MKTDWNEELARVEKISIRRERKRHFFSTTFLGAGDATVVLFVLQRTAALSGRGVDFAIRKCNLGLSHLPRSVRVAVFLPKNYAVKKKENCFAKLTPPS